MQQQLSQLTIQKTVSWEEIWCTECSKPGHTKSQCPFNGLSTLAVRHAKISRIKSPIRRHKSKPIVEFYEICKEYGHDVENCPYNMRNIQRKVKFAGAWCHTYQYANHNIEDCYFHALTRHKR